MALPGISFEIVRSDVPVVGIRSDRTALVAMTQRGRVEEPVLVHSHDQYVAEYGCPLPGTLGPLAAEAYFKNGGEELIVCRFAGPADHATGALGLVDATAPLVEFSARDPGSYGNSVQLVAEMAVVGVAHGVLPATGTLDNVDLTPFEVPASWEGLPVRISNGTAVHWATAALSMSSMTLDFSPAASSGFDHSDDVAVEVYSHTFTLRIREPMRAEVIVPGLDLRYVPPSNAILEPHGIVLEFTPGLYAGVFLPTPGVVVRLAGGTDALDLAAGLPDRAASFQRCIQALEVSDLPDIVIAPDLWSAVWGTKGAAVVGFEPTTAIDLADELVRSAGRTRDRVVLLDPPLTSYSATDQHQARPLAVPEMLAWRADRETMLGEDRDFTAAYTPWTRIVAGPTYRGDDTLLVPPSAAVAGRMARTSRTQGPWAATGNVPLETVIGLADTLSVDDQEQLQDVGICPLRLTTPRGATIQGVRSLSWPDRKPWRFLSTRRLFNFLRRALTPIGMSYTFEPNAPETWIRLRRELNRFLTDLYSRGALAGSRPDQAFFVRCDAALNPEEARDNGVMTALIGVAPAFPLEFLVVKLLAGQGVARVAEEPFVS